MHANFPDARKSLTSVFRSDEQAAPTASRVTGMPVAEASLRERRMADMRESVMFPRLRSREEAVLVISMTSSGCSAMMGFAPRARIAFAHWFIEMGLVMQWIRRLFLLISFSKAYLLR